jgi:peptide chain release factor 1
MDPVIDTFVLDRSEVNRVYTRGSGPGGQNKNKVNSCVVLTHKPTGISVRIDGRDQPKNELEAWTILEKRLRDLHEEKINKEVCSTRNNQIGNGERGNKRRTYRVKDDLVIDHTTGKQTKFKFIERGKVELLH